jgi:phospholipid transport system substrate-binding protein
MTLSQLSAHPGSLPRWQRAALAGAAVAALLSVLAAAASADEPAGPSSSSAPSTADTPDALVRTMSTEVLDTIRADKSLQSGDPAKLKALIDTKVMPFVDFEKMTQQAVGRGWRSATPEQRQELAQQFRTLLVRTYSGAMAQVRDHKVVMLPQRAAATDTDVVVHTQVVSSRSDPIQLDYRLEKEPVGWRIFDVNVLGVWLVENYKTQFASEINQNGVDGLVKSLMARNAANAASSAASAK